MRELSLQEAAFVTGGNDAIEQDIADPVQPDDREAGLVYEAPTSTVLGATVETGPCGVLPGLQDSGP